MVMTGGNPERCRRTGRLPVTHEVRKEVNTTDEPALQRRAGFYIIVEVRQMDNFRAVYRILSTLEKAMDLPEFDIAQINAGALGVTEQRWARYIEMMVDVGYIKGVKIESTISGNLMVQAENMRITLKGLEYLQENSVMQRCYKAAKGIRDIIPGI